MILLLVAMWAQLSGRNDAQIHWVPAGAIVVHVASRDLSPLPGATVSIFRADASEPDGGGAPFKTATSGPGGLAEFRGLPTGTYYVRVASPGSLEMRFGPMPVEGKSEKSDKPPAVRLPEILCVVNPVLAF